MQSAVYTAVLSKMSVPLTVYSNVISFLADVFLYTPNDAAQNCGIVKQKTEYSS